MKISTLTLAIAALIGAGAFGVGHALATTTHQTAPHAEDRYARSRLSLVLARRRERLAGQSPIVVVSGSPSPWAR